MRDFILRIHFVELCGRSWRIFRLSPLFGIDLGGGEDDSGGGGTENKIIDEANKVIGRWKKSLQAELDNAKGLQVGKLK